MPNRRPTPKTNTPRPWRQAATIATNRGHIRQRADYFFFSTCTVCLRSRGEYFFTLSFSPPDFRRSV